MRPSGSSPSTTTAGSAASRASSPTSRRSTSTRRCRGRPPTTSPSASGLNYQQHRRHLHQQRQLFGALLVGRRSGSGLFTPTATGSAGPGHARPCRATPTSTGSDYGWGWNLGVLCRPRHVPAHRRAIPIGDQVHGHRQRQIRQSGVPALPADLPPRRWPRHRAERQLYNSGSQLADQAARDRQPVVLRQAQRAMGGDGRPAVHRLEFDPAADLHAQRRQRRCRAPTRTSRTPGALPSVATTATTNSGCSAAAWPMTSRRCRMPTAPCACPTPTAPGWRWVRATDSTRACGSTSARPISGCAAATSTRSVRRTLRPTAERGQQRPASTAATTQLGDPLGPADLGLLTAPASVGR